MPGRYLRQPLFNKLRNPPLAFAIVAALSLVISPVASAHQPVVLNNSDTTAAKGPLLVDGTVSFAVRASFTKAGQTKALRAGFVKGDRLAVQYLIVDKKPESALKTNQLPVVTMISPTGKRTVIQLNERTKFFEPYGQTQYLYLARYNAIAQTGIYSFVIKSKTKSSITLAIGEKEIQGQVIRGSKSTASCPPVDALDATQGITQLRANSVVGLSEIAAQQCAEILGWGYRVAQRDDEMFALTLDYLMDRISVYVRSGIVTKVDVG